MERYEKAAGTAQQAMAAHAQKQTALAADLFDRAAMEMRTALQLVPASEQSSVAAVVIAKANEYEAFATDLRRSVPSSAPTVTTVTTTTTTTTTTASTTASVSLGSSASVLLALSQINELFVNAKEAERRGDRTLAKATAVKAADALMQRRKANLVPQGSRDYKALLDLLDQVFSFLEKLKALENPPATVTLAVGTKAGASRTPSPAPTQPGTLKASANKLTQFELELLKASSVVNGHVFLPWVDDARTEKLFGLTAFEDPDGLLTLSPKQKSHLSSWRRPHEVSKNPTIMDNVSSYSIVQDIVSDCSFVSSLCIVAMFEKKFNQPLLSNCIYPQDSKGRPLYNESGKYMVKLHYNGIWRKVIIDDLLPIDRSGRLLVTHSTNPDEFFPSLLEKAYLKLMGGYNFPGSNSTVDLHAMTGWIPEQSFMRDDDFNADRQWARLLDGQKFGDALITIATPDMPDEEGKRLGLVPTHAYAVLQVREVDGERLMLIKNPWGNTRWRGKFSPWDSKSWTPSLRRQLGYDPERERANDDGLFWIDYASAIQNYNNIHINWNPVMFSYREIAHSTWPANIGPKRDSYNMGPNPQFWLDVDNAAAATAPLWLLLTKHITKTFMLDENSAQPIRLSEDFITIHVFAKTNGKRVYYNENQIYQGTYINSPHYLARLNVPTGANRFTVVISQHDAKNRIAFTLRVYSTAPLRFGEIPRVDTFEKKVEGAWTEESAGGSSNDPIAYSTNPVYYLRLTHGSNESAKPVNVVLTLAAPRTLAINIKVYTRVLPSGSVSRYSGEDMLVTSGNYRHGFCYVDLSGKVSPGHDYYIVVSTFHPGDVGNFILVANSENHPVDLLRR